LGERGDLGVDPGVKVGDVGAGLVDPGEHLGQQERVVVAEPTGERLLQVGDLAAHPAPGELGEHLGVALPGDQRGQHVAAGDPEDVGDHDAELDLGVLEQLLDPVLLRGPRRDLVGPVPGQVAQHPDRWRWHEAGAEHLPLGDLAQPHRVQPVRLRTSR